MAKCQTTSIKVVVQSDERHFPHRDFPGGHFMFKTSVRMCVIAIGLMMNLPAEAAAAGAPAEMVQLDLWAVTLRVESGAADEPAKPLMTRLANLSTPIGSRDEVQKLLGRLQEQGVVRRLQSFRVTTLSGQESTVVCGERAAVVIGTTISDRGRTNNIQYQQIGTVLKLLPAMVEKDEVSVDLSYERSDLANSDVVIAQPANGETVHAKNLPSVTAATRAKMGSGKAVVVLSSSDIKRNTAELIILSATVVGTGSEDAISE